MSVFIDSDFTEQTVLQCSVESVFTLCETHSTGGVDARPLHGDSNAVEEDDYQHNMVEHLVGDDLIADDSKPDRKHTEI